MPSSVSVSVLVRPAPHPSFDKNTLSTCEAQIPGREHHEIHSLFVALDFVAYSVYISDEGYLSFEKDNGGLWIENLELVQQGCSGGLGPSDNVDLGCPCILDKLLECTLSNTTGGTNEQRHHAWGFRHKTRIRAPNIF